MPNHTLTLLETLSIQDYVFGSNVLQENIGASELVWRATRLWPFELLQESRSSNVRPDPTGDQADLDDGLHIGEKGIDAEVVYVGGGNCAVLFAEGGHARDFVSRLSKKMLAEAPELDFAAVHVEVNWQPGGDALAAKVGDTLAKLAAKKRKQRVSTALMGLGTTVACRSTGLPATGTEGDALGLRPERAAARPLSSGTLAKLGLVREANQRLEEYLPQYRDAGLTIPYDFDNFGREAGEISYIAVVHADGNNFGQRVEKLRQSFDRPSADPDWNRQYIRTMRAFSRAVEGAAKTALETTSERLLDHSGWIRFPAETLEGIVSRTRDDWGEWVEVGGVPFGQDRDKQHMYAPFRPIVFGGDDLTFVTDGRLGLALTAAYLEAFEAAITAQTTNSAFVTGLQASAGMSVVKAHYPFARAYDLAEDLCTNAKQVWDREHSAMDWHFAATGLFGSIGDIRARQYHPDAGHLEARPLLLESRPTIWRSWPGFAGVTKAFLVNREWKDKRNKVVALREALRKGPGPVEHYLNAYGLERLPELDSTVEALQRTGWDGGRCGYFDAVEALDFFLPLDWTEEAA